jgi:ABC-type lipoprotein release transport system permease subunit
LNLKAGENLILMGRKYQIVGCYDERGNQDDISAWIHLGEAQELFNKPGLINAILALECLCTGDVPLARLREEITRILPGTQVIEKGSQALARAETRLNLAEEAKATIADEKRNREILRDSRENFASFLIPVVFLACGIWIAFLGLMNSRARREEIGILRAFGVSVKKVLKTFLYKFFLVGVCGGILGFFGGVLAGILFGQLLEGAHIGFHSEPLHLIYLFLLAAFGSSILAVIAGWIPALVATQQDPAEILHKE